MTDENSGYKPFWPFDVWLENDTHGDRATRDFVITARMNLLKQRTANVSPEVVDTVLSRLGREAAAETGAIEDVYTLSPGQTVSIANEIPGWRETLRAQGDGALLAFESQLACYEFIRAQSEIDRPITEALIREMHKVSCRNQETYRTFMRLADGTLVPRSNVLRHGEYKNSENFASLRDGSILNFAPVFDIVPEMGRLVAEMQSKEFLASDPVLQAAFAHYCLTHIHPFEDGNGRVARALASLFFYGNYRVPVIVYSDRKLTYLQALEAANKGHTDRFVQHLGDRLVDTLARAVQEIEAVGTVPLESALERVMGTLSSHQAISMEAVDVVHGKLHKEITSRVEEMCARLQESSNSSIGVSHSNPPMGNSGNVGTQAFTTLASIPIKLSVDRPVRVSSSVYFLVARAIDLGERFPFRLVASESSYVQAKNWSSTLELRWEDVVPVLSNSSNRRVDLLLREGVKYVLDSLNEAIINSLRQAGYEGI